MSHGRSFGRAICSAKINPDAPLANCREAVPDPLKIKPEPKSKPKRKRKAKREMHPTGTRENSCRE